MLDTLDVVIGLTFYFLLVSLIVMAALEVVEAFRKERSKLLAKGIQGLLQDPSGRGLAARLYSHPLVKPFRLGPEADDDNAEGTGAKDHAADTTVTPVSQLPHKPSYIPPREFALALLDLLGLTEAPTDETKDLAARLKQLTTPATAPESLKGLPAPALAAIQKALRPLLAGVGEDLEKAQRSIEAWYNGAMDRVAGWYKRYAQKLGLVFGIAFVALLNADAVHLTRVLSTDEDVRMAYIAAAEAYIQEAAQDDADTAAPVDSAAAAPGTAPPDSTSPTQAALDGYNEAVDNLESLGVPLGWARANVSAQWPGRVPEAEPPSLRNWAGWLALKVLGLLMTGIAVSMGAPFWFDLLNKMMIVRSTVKPREKSPPEGPVDPPTDPTQPPVILFGNAPLKKHLTGVKTVIHVQEISDVAAPASRSDPDKPSPEAE